MNLSPDYAWLKGLPNQLTLFRMAVVPLILLLYPLELEGLRLFCAALFVIASLTDWLDGFLARRLKMESPLGALLDPTADKMLTAAALIVLASQKVIWAWFAGLLLCREIGMAGLRLVAQQQGLEIPVSIFGKLKTLALDVALVCLLVNRPLFGWPFREVGMVSLWLALFLSLYSAWLYFGLFLEKISVKD